MEEIRHSVPPMTTHGEFFEGTISARLLLGGNAHDILVLQGGEHSDARQEQKMMAGLGNNVLGSHMGESSFGGNATPTSGNPNSVPAADLTSGRPDGSDPRYLGEVTNAAASEDGTGRDIHHVYQGNRGMRGEGDSDERSEGTRPRVHESEMPPALLHLVLANNSQATIVVEIREVNSDLGNFAVRPDTLTLEPGQSKEVEPMQSLLGVESFELPVKVQLRVGGVSESKVLTLRPIKPDEHSGPPPPAATPGH
jgi:hypothetical protein